MRHAVVEMKFCFSYQVEVVPASLLVPPVSLQCYLTSLQDPFGEMLGQYLLMGARD